MKDNEPIKPTAVFVLLSFPGVSQGCGMPVFITRLDEMKNIMLQAD